MNCHDFRPRLEPYVDGELEVSETVAVNAHLTDCPGCRARVDRARQFRQLLRRQPRESAPPELRAEIVARIRRTSRVAALRPWLVAPALAAAALAVFLVFGTRGFAPPTGIIGQLVDKHIAYAQLEKPAEFVSGDQREVSEWFADRAGLRVVVPDYSPAGIHLVGARLADVAERRAAYVLYEKGHTLLSVFMAPGTGDAPDLRGTRLAYRGHDYFTREQKGYRTVAWSDGQAVFALVSMLHYEDLLECADRLRAERVRQTRL